MAIIIILIIVILRSLSYIISFSTEFLSSDFPSKVKTVKDFAIGQRPSTIRGIYSTLKIMSKVYD